MTAAVETDSNRLADITLEEDTDASDTLPAMDWGTADSPHWGSWVEPGTDYGDFPRPGSPQDVFVSVILPCEEDTRAHALMARHANQSPVLGIDCQSGDLAELLASLSFAPFARDTDRHETHGRAALPIGPPSPEVGGSAARPDDRADPRGGWLSRGKRLLSGGLSLLVADQRRSPGERPPRAEHWIESSAEGLAILSVAAGTALRGVGRWLSEVRIDTGHAPDQGDMSDGRVPRADGDRQAGLLPEGPDPGEQPPGELVEWPGTAALCRRAGDRLRVLFGKGLASGRAWLIPPRVELQIYVDGACLRVFLDSERVARALVRHARRHTRRLGEEVCRVRRRLRAGLRQGHAGTALASVYWGFLAGTAVAAASAGSTAAAAAVPSPSPVGLAPAAGSSGLLGGAASGPSCPGGLPTVGSGMLAQMAGLTAGDCVSMVATAGALLGAGLATVVRDPGAAVAGAARTVATHINAAAVAAAAVTANCPAAGGQTATDAAVRAYRPGVPAASEGFSSLGVALTVGLLVSTAALSIISGWPEEEDPEEHRLTASSSTSPQP
ncbi:hypothetical protein H696_00352 [Fonticula alba]|uniref:Uncharacterized protein n=1 Tax=Fonticula alba TaxID=691883 RepID=A0A058ZFS0_FONAL|nr:hypothetical protein H696_00352 [Fonticula alba]KCV72773.1 hypothetical protein H696_00352 [Fonticula alba]|eukprot:XP_009492474.1 hypothetical protein H696_00352 [Fonticula alba]